MEYTIGVLKVTNLREDLVAPQDYVRVCWRRNNRVTETPAVRVIDRMAVIDHSMQMIARM